MMLFEFTHSLATMPINIFWLALAIFLFAGRKQNHTLLLMGITATFLSLPLIFAIVSYILGAPLLFGTFYTLASILVLPVTAIFLVFFAWLVDTRIINQHSNTIQSVNFLFKILILHAIVGLIFVLGTVFYFKTLLPQLEAKNYIYELTSFLPYGVGALVLLGAVANIVNIIAMWSLFAETRNLKTFYKHSVLLLIPAFGIIWYLVMFKQFEQKLTSINTPDKSSFTLSLLIQHTKKVFIFALLTFVGIGWYTFIEYVRADDITRLVSALCFISVAIAFLVFWLKFLFTLRKADEEVNGSKI